MAGHVTVAGLGTEQVECDEDVHNAYYRRLVIVLAGPLFVRRWPTGTWPLDEACPGDIGYAARLCRWLKFDAVDMFLTECRVTSLVREPSVHRAIRDVGSELLTHGALPGDRVHELVAGAGVDASAVRALVPLREPPRD